MLDREPPEYLSTDELAQLTGRSRKTIWRWCRDRVIRADPPPPNCSYRIRFNEAARVFPAIREKYVSDVSPVTASLV